MRSILDNFDFLGDCQSSLTFNRQVLHWFRVAQELSNGKSHHHC